MRKPSLNCALLLLLVSVSLAQAPSPASPEIEQKVNAVLNKMTLEQKIDLLGGINTFDVRGYPDLGLPLLHTADGPIGIRNDGPATTMAGGIALAATWDPALAKRVGVEIGRAGVWKFLRADRVERKDHTTKRHNAELGPVSYEH
jgi:beta-glucosidase